MKSNFRKAPTIMRSSTLWQLLLVGTALVAAPLAALAQTAKDAPPPTLQKLDEGEAPAITIRKPEPGNKTTETREQGVVTDVKVQTGKSSYHLIQNPGPGNAAPGDAQSSRVRAAQFNVHEFDLGRKKKGDKQAEDLNAGDLPPPPPEKK
ncbi:hypothetical protein RCH09_002371 [Actimicrobium sp. GrIS 1.19]|uniref:DUF2782 domain-containing protein n=1 Tax=Actimicrobium sp. GrIS 1.19 TaxID=3071708 RepID=UPI002DFB22D4|nr:hypothetical protein [Actimicrobium sp. GrIS 1.19]